MPILTPEEVLARITAASILKESASDEDASKCVSIYPALKGDGSLIKAGTRINYNGTLKRASFDFYDTADNTPDNAPKLYEDIDYKHGRRVIRERIKEDKPVSRGEVVYINDELYESLVDNNIKTPTEDPISWKRKKRTRK